MSPTSYLAAPPRVSLVGARLYAEGPRGSSPTDGPAAGEPSATETSSRSGYRKAVSLPPKNFPPKDLLLAANRCVYGSSASGGGVVKSIEIY